MQPVLDAELARHPEFAPSCAASTSRPVLALARELLAERPRTRAELRAALAERFPDLDAGALAYACRCLLPLVQVPPRGVWGRSGQVTVDDRRGVARAPARGRPVDRRRSSCATSAPSGRRRPPTWRRGRGSPACGEVLERLRPRLRTFRDERGRELFDLPDAPRPDPDTPAPPRFLPEYDNVAPVARRPQPGRPGRGPRPPVGGRRRRLRVGAGRRAAGRRLAARARPRLGRRHPRGRATWPCPAGRGIGRRRGAAAAAPDGRRRAEADVRLEAAP